MSTSSCKNQNGGLCREHKFLSLTQVRDLPWLHSRPLCPCVFLCRITVTEDLSWQREVGLQGTQPISTALDQHETLQSAQTKAKPTTGAHASNRERRALDTSRCEISVSWSNTLDNRYVLRESDTKTLAKTTSCLHTIRPLRRSRDDESPVNRASDVQGASRTVGDQ